MVISYCSCITILLYMHLGLKINSIDDSDKITCDLYNTNMWAI